MAEPSVCTSCGRRTELHDQFGQYRCTRCRAELWPHVFGDERPWLKEVEHADG